MKQFTVFNAVTTAASQSSTSDAIDLEYYDIQGFFSLQLTITGNGTAKIEYESSNDNTTFDEPSSATDLFTGLTVGSGPGSDGKLFDQVEIALSRWVRFKITETGGANSVTITAKLVAI